MPPLPKTRRNTPTGVSTRKNITVSNIPLLILPRERESLFQKKSIFSLTHDDKMPVIPKISDNVRKTRVLKTRCSTRNPTVMTSMVSLDLLGWVIMLKKRIDKRGQRCGTAQNDQYGHQHDQDNKWQQPPFFSFLQKKPQ